MNREVLEQIYVDHHARGDRCGFVFGGDARGHLLRALIGTGRRVLDVGCRDGSLTRFYTDGNDVVGVDVDRVALQRCQRGLAIETHWADVSDGLPFEDETFDLVVAAEILEHLPAPTAVVGEIARVLRPNGLFVGTVPNAFRLKNRLVFLLGRDFEGDPTHLHHFSPGSLRHMLARRFATVDLQFAIGRFLTAWPRMLGNCIVWRATKAPAAAI